MNKFLMMSAAVVMGTVAAGNSQPASAAHRGEAEFTVNYHPCVGCATTFCDWAAGFVRSHDKTYSVIASEHIYTSCPSLASVGPSPGNGVVVKKNAYVSDLSFAVLGVEASAMYVLSYPFNQVKKGMRRSTFDIWASTNGTTSFLVNSGWQGPRVKGGKLIGPTFETTGAKLDSLLKVQHRQQ
jgi:hypothetical protein